MYTLFETPNPNQPGRFFYQRSDGLRRRWQENLVRLQSHWANSGYGVKSEHILSRLVGSFTIPLYNDVRKYRDSITDLLPQLTMANNIASPTNGRVSGEPGWFYGLDNREFLLSVQGDFEPVAAAKNWEILEPLRVLRHTLTDVNMALPNGDVPDVGDGFVVIAIDIPLLAVQYWGWLRHQLTTTETPQRIQQLIGQYTLPAMLWSQTTVGWFNYLSAVGIKPTTPTRKVNSIALATNDVNNALLANQILTDSRINKMTFRELMGCIPTVRSESMLRVLQKPKTVVTRQNQWALEMAYVPYVNYGLRHINNFDKAQGIDELNNLKRLTTRITSDRILDAAPSAVRASLLREYNELIGNELI